MKMRSGFFAAALAAAFLAAHTSQAEAGFALMITEGGTDGVVGTGGDDNTFTIHDQELDGGGDDDLNSTVGIILFTASIGDFTLTVTTGQSKPFLAGNNNFQAHMKLSVTASTGIGTDGGELQIKLTDTDFDLAPDVAGSAILTSMIGGVGAVNSVVDASQHVNFANVEFGLGP